MCRPRSTRRAPICPRACGANPTYRKVNPADAPILILSLTSDTRTRGQIYDAASLVLVPALSQIRGVGQVTIGGGAARAVRVEIDPAPLFQHGIGLEDVRAAIASANAHSPKGAIEDGTRRWQLYAKTQPGHRRQERVPSPPLADVCRKVGEGREEDPLPVNGLDIGAELVEFVGAEGPREAGRGEGVRERLGEPRGHSASRWRLGGGHKANDSVPVRAGSRGALGWTAHARIR